MNISVVFGTSCAIALAACTLSAPKPAEIRRYEPAANIPQTYKSAGLKRIWTLEEWPGFTPDALRTTKAEINLTALPHVSAYMGCNRMMFSADTSPHQSEQGSISIGPVAATRMLCQGNMDLEMSFAARIGSFTHYRLNGSRLVLENEDGKKAVFIARD
ncbi:MAG: META domain-containing protein [Neisseria sp.]|nr:META domain-containing protein [Neisseria sp.]